MIFIKYFVLFRRLFPVVTRSSNCVINRYNISSNIIIVETVAIHLYKYRFIELVYIFIITICFNITNKVSLFTCLSNDCILMNVYPILYSYEIKYLYQYHLSYLFLLFMHL